MNETSTVCFHGGAGAVTGANFLLDVGDGKILIDCGLAQGDRFASEKNYAPFPYDPATISHLLVTHAHIDHIGRIPKLVREGFRGTIIATPPTRELTPLLLFDALKILEDEARIIGGEPLYTRKDVDHTLSLFEDAPYGEQFPLPGGVEAVFRNAGHILGSAMIEVGKPDGKHIVFTGDLGNSPTPLLPDTDPLPPTTYLVIESVYGDRDHEDPLARQNRLRAIIREAVARGGTLLMPIFSVEKTQVILHELNELLRLNLIPSVPVFLDSPLAISVTEVYRRNREYFNDEAKQELASGDDIFNFPKLRLTKDATDSDRIVSLKGPKIIIAGSGMSTGGRIIRHEARYLGDPRNTIAFVGYQAAGSLGREIEEGTKKVRIGNEKIRVKARIEKLSGYSSHKDGTRLLEFVAPQVNMIERAFVVMGEPRSSSFFAQRLKDYLNIEAVVPQAGECFPIDL